MKKQLTPRTSKATIVIAFIILALATSTTVYLLFGRNDKPTAFFARSINDATYDCEDKIESRFGKRLVSKYYDQYSSRYEADDHQYLVYYRVSATEEDDRDLPTMKNYMVKCVVWERLGYVSDFQVFDKF